MSSRLVRLVCLVALLIASAATSFAGVRFGGFNFGFGYTYFSGPVYSYYYDGFYGPWGYGYGYPLAPVFYLQPDPNRGTVKLKNTDKTASVYINGAFAGVAGDLKTFSLEPGAYDMEVRSFGRKPEQKRIYVLSGKTLKLSF